MADPVLWVDNVTVRFDGVVALDSVDLRVEPGDRWAVIGPNGAGKTTLFRAIMGEVYPTRGRVHLFGADVSRVPPHRKAQKGLARTFQITNLFGKLTVEENLVIAAQARTMSRFAIWRPLRVRGALDDRITSALESVGLRTQRYRQVSELSHGEQRQLEIAMALAGEPRLLLLDEPAAGLSAAERKTMRQLISSLPVELPTVLIEHDMSIALDLAERVLVLDNGQRIAEGSPNEIRGNQRVQDVYLKSE
ncbi:MAG TPA: ABC transporter ATP-binding protein [Acidimicrobiia bacterium]